MGFIVGFCVLWISASYVLAAFGHDPVDAVSERLVDVILGTFITWVTSVTVDHATANFTGRIVKESTTSKADDSAEG
jgi:hypothetical protein